MTKQRGYTTCFTTKKKNAQILQIRFPLLFCILDEKY